MLIGGDKDTMTKNHPSWSLPILLWQKVGLIENFWNTNNQQERKADNIHKKCSIDFIELVSETASSSSTSDLDTITRSYNDENHQEYDALLYPEGQKHFEEHKIDECPPLPTWNTIKSYVTNKMVKKIVQTHHDYTINNCNHNEKPSTMIPMIGSAGTSYRMDNKAYSDVDDDDYDSDSDAIHVLYYNHPTVRDDSSIRHYNYKSLHKQRNDQPNLESVSDVCTADNLHLQTSEYIASMIDEYDFYSIMYTTNQICDIRIYESLLTLLLFSNKNISNIDNCDHFTTTSDYDEAIQTVATFLVDPSIPFPSKLDVLQILLVQQCRDRKQQRSDSHLTWKCFSNDIVTAARNTTCAGAPNRNEDEIILIPGEIVRDMYAFCISLYFGVNDIEHTIQRCSHDVNQMNHDYCNMVSDGTITTTSALTTTAKASSASSQQLLCPMIWELRSKCLYLQEMYTIYDDLSVMRQQTRVPVTGSPPGSVSLAQHCEDPCWEYIKNYCYDHDSILLQDIDLLKALYHMIGKNKSLRYIMLIASIGYLRICMYHQEGVTTKNYYKYSEALHNVTLFLSNWMVSDGWKMAVLYCLQYNMDVMSNMSITNNALSCNSFHQNKTSDDHIYYSKVLSFCTCDDAYTDSFLVMSPQNSAVGVNQPPKAATRKQNYDNDASSLCAFYLLLWELRVLTCHHKKQRQELHQRFVLLLQHRIVQFRAFISKSASKIGNNSSIISTKQALTNQLPAAAVVIKTKVNQVRTTIQSKVRICHVSFTQKCHGEKQ